MSWRPEPHQRPEIVRSLASDVVWKAGKPARRDASVGLGEERSNSYSFCSDRYRNSDWGTTVAVRIRMKPMGRKHRAYYRIVAIDGRQPNDGRVIEEVGTYDPQVP